MWVMVVEAGVVEGILASIATVAVGLVVTRVMGGKVLTGVLALVPK
jgi:hypothetical protein